MAQLHLMHSTLQTLVKLGANTKATAEPTLLPSMVAAEEELICVSSSLRFDGMSAEDWGDDEAYDFKLTAALSMNLSVDEIDNVMATNCFPQ